MPLVAWGRYGFGESFVAEIRRKGAGSPRAEAASVRNHLFNLHKHSPLGGPPVHNFTDTNPTCSIQVSNSLRAASHCNRCRSLRSRTLWCKGGNRSKVMFAG
jgi:hypothetical protein